MALRGPCPLLVRVYGLNNVIRSKNKASAISLKLSQHLTATPRFYATASNADEKNEEKPRKQETISKAMRAYLQRSQEHDEFMKKQNTAFQIGKRHLANMMGEDPETFTQADIDRAIEYLLPSGLFDPRARPIMRSPEEVFPQRKAAEFDLSGRPHHTLFYTSKPNFYQLLHDTVDHLQELNKFEDRMIRNGVKSDPKNAVDLSGSVWLPKDEVEKTLVEILTEKDYAMFLKAIQRLAEHPYSTRCKDFIKLYQKPLMSQTKTFDIPKLEFDEEGRSFITTKDCMRKKARGVVMLRGNGSGKITINDQDITYFKDMQQREQQDNQSLMKKMEDGDKQIETLILSSPNDEVPTDTNISIQLESPANSLQKRRRPLLRGKWATVKEANLSDLESGGKEQDNETPKSPTLEKLKASMLLTRWLTASGASLPVVETSKEKDQDDKPTTTPSETANPTIRRQRKTKRLSKWPTIKQGNSVALEALEATEERDQEEKTSANTTRERYKKVMTLTKWLAVKNENPPVVESAKEEPDDRSMEYGTPPPVEAPQCYSECFNESSCTEETNYSFQICKDSIQSQIKEHMKGVGGRLQVLEDLEMGQITARNVKDLAETWKAQEINVLLLYASFLGLGEVIPELHKAGADLNHAEPEQGLTAMHLCAFSNSLVGVKYLMRNGADVHFMKVYTPFHYTAFGNSVNVAQYFLSEGVRPDTIEYKESVLQCAATSNAADVLKLIAPNNPALERLDASSGLAPIHQVADQGKDAPFYTAETFFVWTMMLCIVASNELLQLGAKENQEQHPHENRR